MRPQAIRDGRQATDPPVKRASWREDVREGLACPMRSGGGKIRTSAQFGAREGRTVTVDQTDVGRGDAPLKFETHKLRVDPGRSMKAITDEVEALLDGLEETSRRTAALMASELIAQVVGRAPESHGEPARLTVQLREDVVRMEATGPVPPSAGRRSDPDSVPADPLADWGRFILDRLADRWGVGGDARRALWAEIERLA
jgi:hypothetical protein